MWIIEHNFLLLLGNNLLHVAALNGNEKAGLFLASHGAQPDKFNNEGETPLHVAARNGMVALVKELLNKYVYIR